MQDRTTELIVMKWNGFDSKYRHTELPSSVLSGQIYGQQYVFLLTVPNIWRHTQGIAHQLKALHLCCSMPVAFY